MKMRLYKVKIGHREYKLGAKDLFLDNGAIVQCMTQTYFQGWSSCNPVLAKATAAKWKRLGVLFTTEDLKLKALKLDKTGTCNYYRLDLSKLAALGYESIEVDA